MITHFLYKIHSYYEICICNIYYINVSFQNKEASIVYPAVWGPRLPERHRGLWGIPCDWAVLATIQNAAPTQAVKTLIAAASLLWWSPPQSWDWSTKTGKWKATTTCTGSERFHAAGRAGVTVGLYWVSWGAKGLHRLRQIQQWSMLERNYNIKVSSKMQNTFQLVMIIILFSITIHSFLISLFLCKSCANAVKH